MEKIERDVKRKEDARVKKQKNKKGMEALRYESRVC